MTPELTALLQISAKLDQLTTQGAIVALDLSRITSEVTEIRGAGESARTLITEIAQALRDSGGDQNAVNALADDLDAGGTALAEAVAANQDVRPGGGSPPA